MEVIKNISLSLVSVSILGGSIFFYIKIYFNARKIREINEKIEEKQKELDRVEIDDVRGTDQMCYKIDLGNEARDKKRLEQKIDRLKREKNNLLEEISIFKIFKK